MVRRLSVSLCLIAAVGFVALPAFAAVQNVKISGDISVSGVHRNNLDLDKARVNDVTAAGDNRNDKQEDFLSITRVKVDADLTDNVSTSVRLLNERNWNGDSNGGGKTTNRNIGGIVNALDTNSEEHAVNLDLASVTLKEFLYSPLTLTVGRQELRFGNGWIVGDPDTNGITTFSASGLEEGDLSARKAFDALRAKFDYNPLVLDIIYAKVAENNTTRNDDTSLAGINAAYELSSSTTLEGFYFTKKRNITRTSGLSNLDSALTTSFDTTTPVKQKDDVVNTIGVRAVNKSVKNLTLDGQIAYQFGTYNPKLDPNARFISAANKAETSPRSAWGVEVVGTYDLKDIAKLAQYEPTITGAYVYLSGESRDKTGAKAYKGWDAMFEDQSFGHLINAIMGFSNCHLVGTSLKVKPATDVTAKLDYITGWFAKKYAEGRAAILSGVSTTTAGTTATAFTMSNKANFGHEVDLTLLYDYTEDVQLSLLGGIFIPSKAINGNKGVYPYRQKADAVELIGSMKVTF